MHKTRPELFKIYKQLYKSFGHQHWWPGETTLEIMVGAILTQNTNWQNVEKAITNLKKNKSLTLPALKKIPMNYPAASCEVSPLDLNYLPRQAARN